MKRWPLHKAYFWETAPFFRILLPFSTGIVCYDHFRYYHFSGTIALVLIVAMLLTYLALVLLKKNKGGFAVVQFAVISILFLLCGYSVASLYDVRNNKSWFGRDINKQKNYVVKITYEPAEKENTWKLPVSVICGVDSGRVMATTGKAFLYLFKDRFPMLLHQGDTLFVPGDWQPVKNAGNPFEFDYAGYCSRNNIYYQQFCSVKDTRLLATNDPHSTPFIDQAHNWCMKQLALNLPEPKTRGLIQAMLLGDEVNLDEELLQSYSETGIVHIIAISGGNVAIFFVAISGLLWWLKNKKHLWIKYAIALPLVWFYVMMAGANPSAIRAAVMFSLLAGGIMLQKSNNSLNQLLATAFLLLCAQPMWLFSVGFQLSFVAVLSLILFYNPVYKWLSPANKIIKGLWSAVVASISAEVLVAPLVVYYFHIFPLLFIVANVAAYLFMGLVLYMSMAIIALSWIPIASKIIGNSTIWIVTWFDKIVSWLQSCNPQSFRYIMLTGLELALIYFFIAGISLFLMKKNKTALFTGIIAVCLLLVCFCTDQRSRMHQHRMIIYNAGKSNHIELISGSNYTVLYKDTGSQIKTDYIVKPTHIGWRACKQDSTKTQEIGSINGKSFLILNYAADTSIRFHTDFLIINYIGKIEAKELQKIFSPSLIIIGNKYTRRQQQRFKKDFAKAGLQVHCISEDGAFVLE